MKDPSYLSACEGGTECSETSAYKIHTPRNYPEESIQHTADMWGHAVGSFMAFDCNKYKYSYSDKTKDDGRQRRAAVDMVKKHRVPENARNFLDKLRDCPLA